MLHGHQETTYIAHNDIFMKTIFLFGGCEMFTSNVKDTLWWLLWSLWWKCMVCNHHFMTYQLPMPVVSGYKTDYGNMDWKHILSVSKQMAPYSTKAKSSRGTIFRHRRNPSEHYRASTSLVRFHLTIAVQQRNKIQYYQCNINIHFTRHHIIIFCQ